MTAEYDCSLSLNVPGNAELSERGEQSEYGSWSSTSLVERDEDFVGLTVTMDNDHVKLELRVHHVENEETKRAFHSTLECNLEREDIVKLRDFLDMILKWDTP